MGDTLRDPSFKRLVLITCTLWTLFGVMAGFQQYANTTDVRSSFPLKQVVILTLGDAWLRALVAIPLLVALLYLHEKVKRWPVRLAVYVVLFVAFAAIHLSIRPLVLPFVLAPSTPLVIMQQKYSYRDKVEIAARSFFLIEVMGFTCIVIFFNAWVYAAETQRRALNEVKLAARLASAELQVLKMQLQPHFLFNTLNTIYNLAPQNSRKAQLMISRLSNLLRLSLDHVSTNLVPLQQELEFLDSYLDIETTRFEERLQIVRDIDPETLDAAVPNLLLQPLAENAIRHGISKKASGGTLKIHSRKVGSRLLIIMTDDGHLPSGTQGGGGIGMANTRARLTQLFGSDFKFELSPAGEGAQVTIDLPFQLSPIQQEEPVS